jgi:hypothetical protein
VSCTCASSASLRLPLVTAEGCRYVASAGAGAGALVFAVPLLAHSPLSVLPHACLLAVRLSAVYRAGSAMSLNIEAVAPECSVRLAYWQKWTAVEIIPVITGTILFLAYLIMNAQKLGIFSRRARRVARLRITDRRHIATMTKAAAKAATKAAAGTSHPLLLCMSAAVLHVSCCSACQLLFCTSAWLVPACNPVSRHVVLNVTSE